MDEPSEGRQNSFHGPGGVGVGGGEQIKTTHAFKGEFEARSRVTNLPFQRSQIFIKHRNPTCYYNARLCYCPNKRGGLVHALLTLRLEPGAGSGHERKEVQHKTHQGKDISEEKHKPAWEKACAGGLELLTCGRRLGRAPQVGSTGCSSYCDGRWNL